MDRVKLHGVVQAVLRKYGINVQRYWNGAVGLRLFPLLKRQCTYIIFLSSFARLSALPRLLSCYPWRYCCRDKEKLDIPISKQTTS